VASRADHESYRSLAKSSERRPRGIEHRLALDHHGWLELLGSTNGISNDSLGGLMNQATFKDEPCRGGYLVVCTRHKEWRVVLGRLPGGELDGAGGACRSIHTHDDEALVGVLDG
jgi:hypothetical protein